MRMNGAIICVPILWAVVYTTTIIVIILTSVRKKYVRLSIPIVCSAGGKNEAHHYYMVGSALSSSLMAATAILWQQSVLILDDSKREAVFGAVLAVASAVFFYLTAHFSIFERPNLHNAMFGTALGFAFAWGGLMLGVSAQLVPNWVWGLRLALYIWLMAAMPVVLIMLEHGKEIKKKHAKEQDKPVDENKSYGSVETDQDEPTSDVEKGLYDYCDDNVPNSDEMPWDCWLRRAALLQYFSLAVFVGLILTTIAEMWQATS